MALRPSRGPSPSWQRRAASGSWHDGACGAHDWAAEWRLARWAAAADPERCWQHAGSVCTGAARPAAPRVLMPAALGSVAVGRPGPPRALASCSNHSEPEPSV